MGEVKFLSGTRFHPKANKVFRMTRQQFDSLDFESEEFMKVLRRYILDHKNEQVPRLQELKRYYLSDNNIKYRKRNNDPNRADNRIASDFAKYIAVFMQGYLLGNPIKYRNEDDDLLAMIEAFNIRNNEPYHNGLLETDLSTFGRAYELITMDQDANEKLTKLDVEQTFVIYDDTTDMNSLFGVRYYPIEFSARQTKTYIEVYTENRVYRYVSDHKGLIISNFKYQVPSNPDDDIYFLKGVPINEYSNNEERTGDFESQLDNIDAYDLSQSELANFQQDMNDAYLVIVGNPLTGTGDPDDPEDANSPQNVVAAMLQARILALDNNPDEGGASPNAFYLTKEYDTTGSEEYKKRLVNDILRFTFTPDVTDQNFSGIQSGVAMAHKLMGLDNLRKTKERLLDKGIMRRLRLVANVWEIKNDTYVGINNTNLIFTPNVPQNDKEYIEMIKSIYGLVSDETFVMLLEPVTGIDAAEELKRLASESPQIDDEYNDFVTTTTTTDSLAKE